MNRPLNFGNFAGGGKTLNNQGVLKYGGILRVTFGKDGSYVGGAFRSTYMNSVGLPTRAKANEMGGPIGAGVHSSRIRKQTQ